MKRHGRELTLAALLGLLLLALAVWAPAFFSAAPLRSLLTREAPVLVVACGMALVIIARQIDISVGSQFSVCSVVAGLLAAAGWPVGLVLPAAIACGALLGAVNGVLVAGLGLPSIVVTLATMVALRQGLNLAQQGRFVNLPEHFPWLGLGQVTGQVLLLVVALVGWVGCLTALRWLAAGRQVYAVGSDAEAARLAGIRPQVVTFATFLVLGALTGLAAFMNA
ncbi:MAG: ABC transporter permease, partial [Opitutaceae bacterium]|nr:ABC transporter permease [Opitutaceae bacterium]